MSVYLANRDIKNVFERRIRYDIVMTIHGFNSQRSARQISILVSFAPPISAIFDIKEARLVLRSVISSRSRVTPHRDA
jgi:hypothetical protein